MGIPNKFDRLGAITTNKLPAGYLAAEFLEFSQQINTPYKVQDYLAPKELYIDLKLWRNDPNGGMWLSLIGYNNSEQYIQRISIAGSDYNVQQHNDWACQWVAPNNRGGFKYQGQVDFTRRNKVLYKNSTVDINGTKTESPLNGTGSHVGGATVFINQPSNYATMQLYRASYAESNIKIFDYIPCITSTGQAVLHNKVDGSELTVAYSSIGLSVYQARTLSKLPIGGGTLTVSLPWEAQWDAGVQSALDVASTNGWTIVVQYRDPEVATTNIPASFLESTGTQYIDTEVLSGNLSFDAVVRGCAGSSCCVIGGRMNDSYGNNILGSSVRKGWQFVYDFWLQTGALTYQPLQKYHVRSILGTLFVDGVIASETSEHDFSLPYSLLTFANNRNNTEVNLLSSMQMWYLTIKDKLDMRIRDFVPMLDISGTPCLYDRITKQPFYNSGTGSFIAGFDTAKQSLKLATLPDVTAETDTTKKFLTVSLPWEAQLASTGVPAALQVAAARGWTITVQYREPEVATENISIDYLESTGTQYIDAGLRYSAYDTYSQTLDLSITDKNHEGSTGVNLLGWCTTKNGVYQMLDIGTTPIGDRDIIHNTFLNGTRSLYVNGVEAVKLTTSNLWVNIIAGIFTLGNHNNMWFNPSRNLKAKLYSAKFMQNDVLARDMIPSLARTGTPCLYDKITKTSFYNNGTGVFIAGFETTDKAALGLSKLPVVATGELTVSLPAAAQDDTTFVPKAIEVAKQRGWTIITQYRED